MIRAGAPTATQKSGRSPVTTELAPTATFFPILDPGKTTTPCPSHYPLPIETGRSGWLCSEIGR